MKLRYISLLVFVVLFGAQIHAAVGTTKGNLSVNQGNANYTINIEVPPGIAGMEPALSLNYSSNSNNGHMGVGWNIGGVSSISRCSQIKAIDGENHNSNVNYDSQDRFCLDGKRLINISGNYSAADTEYRTEIDTYSKVVSKGNLNSGPLYFEVKTKSGLTYTYGNDNSSSLSVTNGPARFWKVAKIVDQSGNEINFHYLKNEIEGSHYLSKVTYADNVIDYVYESRPDILRGYQSGSSSLIDKRLKEVIVTTSNQEIRRYKVTYENETSGSKRSKVISITEQVTEGDLKTLHMTYESSAGEFTESSIMLPVEVVEGAAFIDLNNDGFIDIASQDKLWTNRGDGTFNAPVALEIGDGVVMQDNLGTWKLSDIPNHFRVYVDFEQDGDIDCYVAKESNVTQRTWVNGQSVNVYHYNLYRYLNNGNGGMIPDINPDRTKSIEIMQFYKPLGSSAEAFKFIDFSNDGIVDILATSLKDNEGILDDDTEYAFIFLNSSSGTYQVRQLGSALSDIYIDRLFVFDVDGDGFVDIYDANDWLGNLIHYNDRNCYSNGPCTFSTTNSPINSPASSSRFVDLNGDQLIDIYQINDNGADTVWLNKGKGGFENSFFPDPVISSRSDLKLIDLNEDGYPDIYIINSGEDTVWLNDGQGNFPSQSYNVSVDTDEKNLVFADLNGDGSVEIVETDSTKKVWENLSKQPLLTHITNHTDEDIIIAYKPMIDTGVYYSYVANGERNNYPWNNIDNDNIELTTSRQLVSSVDRENGVGGYNRLRYKYFGYIFNKLRGPQGFHSIEVYDDTTHIESKTIYKQIEAPSGEGFQYTGVPYYSYTKEYGITGLLSENTIEYADSISINGVEGTPIHQPYPYSSAISRFDPDTKQPLSTKYQYNCLDNSVIDGSNACEDAPVPITDESGVGNILMSVSKTVDYINNQDFTKTTYNYYQSAVSNKQNWITGKLSRKEIVHQQTESNNIVKSSEFEYNSQGLLTKEIANAGTNVALTKNYTYDSFGNIKTETTSGYGIPTATTTYGYSSNGKFQTSIEDATGLVETRTFDPRFGTVNSITGPNDLTTSWVYDGLGRKIQEDRADGTQIFWNYSWDDGSLMGVNNGLYSIEVVKTGEPATMTYYDMLGREVGSYSDILGKRVKIFKTYNEKGQLIEETLPHYVGETFGKVETFYDDFGRVVSVIKPGPNDTLQTYGTTYSNFTTITTDPNQNKKKTVKNAIGQTLSTTDAFDSGIDSTVTYTYDALGNLLTTADSAENIIEMRYDVAGNKSYMNDPDLGVWNYSYNALGQLLHQWSGADSADQSRRYTYYVYDKLGRIDYKKTYDRFYVVFVDHEDYSFHTTRYIYNDNTVALGSRGKLDQVYTYSEKEFGTDYQMQKKTFTYDGLGRQIQVNNYINYRGDYVSTASYYESGENIGKVKSMTYPNGYEITYYYQGGILDYVEGSDGKIHYKIDDLNAFGDITKASFANGVNTENVYDKAGYLNDIISGILYANDVQQLHYTYDPLGNVKTREDHYSLTGGNIKDTYTYDEMNRLHEQSMSNTTLLGQFAKTKRYTYDHLGNITYLDAYTYDDGDKLRISGEVYGEYKYDPGRPHAVTSIEISPGVVSHVYEYDDVGNMINRNGDTITYNLHNKPATITNGSNNKTVKFYYGIDGQRFKKVFDNYLYTYYIDKSYEEQVEGYETKEICYINIGGKTVGTHTEVKNTYYLPTHENYNEASYNRYFHTDALGSITAITDDNGTVLERRSHDAFGKIRAMDYGVNNNLGLANRVIETTRAYTGHEQIAEVSGLIHMNARAYDSDIGRFLSADTLIQDPEDSQYFNRYSYVRNNPMNYTDPTGHETADLGPIDVYDTYDFSYIPDYSSDYGYGIGISASPYDYGSSSFDGGVLVSASSYESTNSGSGNRYGWSFMGDSYSWPGYVTGSWYILRTPEPRSVTIPASYADLTKFSQKSVSTAFTSHLESVARSPYSRSLHIGGGLQQSSMSFLDRAMSKVSSLVTDYGDLAYTAFTFSNVGATYDTISQYASGEIGGVQAAAMLGAGIFFGGAGSKSVAAAYKALNATKRNVTVYRSLDSTNKVQYVGITNNIERRAAEHGRDKGISINEISDGLNLTRQDARNVEQALIEHYGLDNLLNVRNSISPKRSNYHQRVNRGNEILNSLGYFD